MIELLEMGPTVVAYRADGNITREDIERVFDEMDRRLESADRINVYGEVASFSGMTLDALWQDLKLGFQRWGDVSRIDRAALVTDVGWLRNAAVLEDKVLRGIDLRVFSLDDQDEARNWIRT